MTIVPAPLENAIQAIKSGDKATGRRLLAEALRVDPRNEQAWLWMSGVVDSDEQRRQCLERVLAINPANALARQGLAALQHKALASSAADDRPGPPGLPGRVVPPGGAAQKGSRTVLTTAGIGVLLCCVALLLGGGLYAYRFFSPYIPPPEMLTISRTHPIVYDGGAGFSRDLYAITLNGSDPRLLFSPGGIKSCENPVWSPDGSRVAFVSDKDGNYEIYVLRLDGSGVSNVTNHPAFDADPAWSPDGTRIAFVSDRADGSEIFVMNADGSGVRQLTDMREYSYEPDWSPDGGRIAFAAEGRDDQGKRHYEIFVMSAAGSARTQLTYDRADGRNPAWSPDGTRIAFTSRRDGEAQVHVMNSDGSHPLNLTNHPGGGEAPTWSPDGAYIAFMAARDENWDIYVMKADGSGQTRLTQSRGYDGNPAWKP
jgi:Tol biopolymer transport system component